MITHHRTRVVAALASAAVIVLISREDLDDPSRWWAIIATFVVAIGLVWAMPIVQRVVRPGVAPGIVVGVAAISYACVPETDQFPWLVTVPATMAVVEVLASRRLWFGWIYGAAAVVLWGGIYGATGRQSALVGAVFAWWPVLVLAIVVAVRPAFAQVNELLRWLVVACGASAAAIVSRTGALEPTGGPAVVGAVVGAAASLASALVIAFASTFGDPAGGEAAE